MVLTVEEPVLSPRFGLSMALSSATLDAPDESAALEALHDANATDGLPVVIPTAPRVERMVLASGLDPDMLLGAVGPNLGAATVEKAAINAVMAGCLPDHFPVVVAAVRAICRPELDMTELQATTHCIAPLLIVNGPARLACGPIASGWGALGPGHRANAAIGRAVRLVMMNIGGARPGVSDMALLGHQGKFSSCLAENEEGSALPPLHTSLGFGADQSVVTVVGTEAPHSVVHVGDADDPTSPDRLLNSLAATIANLGSNNAFFRRGAVVVVLNPDHALTLARAGLDRAAIQHALYERAVNPRRTLRALNPAFAGAGNDDESVRAIRDPQDVLVLMAGGGGLYSMVMPSWGAGLHGNPYVSEIIELDQACAIPARA